MTSTIILLKCFTMHHILKIILLVGLCGLAAASEASIGGQPVSSELKEMLSEIEAVIQKGKENIWKEIEPEEPLWNFPPWLGTFFMSEYYFELKAMNITQDFKYPTKFDPEHLKNKLLREQEADGSWKQLDDDNQKTGSLDATIFNYWFLKDYGIPLEQDVMKKAKKWILDHGGIENAQIMTKFKLATFGVYEWVLLPYVPLFIFSNGFPFYSLGYIKDYVAQWVYPHLTALAYFRYHKTVFTVSRVCLQELRTSRSDHCEEYLSKYPHLSGFSHQEKDSSVDNLLEEVIKLRGPRGAFGAYTISTILNLLSFKDYTLRYGADNNFAAYYQKNLFQSLDFVEEMYFNRRASYDGSLDDGRYWDTILCAFALLEAGQSAEKLHPTIQYLVRTAVQENGGIPYGWEFEYAPDIDDTAMLLMLYGKMLQVYNGTEIGQFYEKEINRTYTWLKNNQNGDGGFPAFDRDKNDDQYKLIKLIFKITQIDKSAQVFDPSCADIVGHMFEAMGDSNLIDYDVITKGAQFLYNTRKDGMWSARWGINYVYAVGAVLPGLARVGYDLNTQWVRDVVKRVQEVQQADGGFGEDSQSYNLDKYKEGTTTASMTAWGLLSYVDISGSPIPNIQQNIAQAIRYLLNNFKENEENFFDRSVVGTGHRGVLNLQYPVYAYSFPLVALSRAARLIKGQYSLQPNQDLSNKVNAILGINAAAQREL